MVIWEVWGTVEFNGLGFGIWDLARMIVNNLKHCA